ncbi:MAG: hypothetical protein WAN38_09505, partial [Terriglobales bacterium]
RSEAHEADAAGENHSPGFSIDARGIAVRYHIPLGTIRDWEQGRAEPDKPTEACLKVIARAPERIERLLNSRAHRVQLANPTRRKARGEPGTALARAFTALL